MSDWKRLILAIVTCQVTFLSSLAEAQKVKACRNILVDSTTGKSSFGTVRAWPLRQVLSVLTGDLKLIKLQESLETVKLIGFMLDIKTEDLDDGLILRTLGPRRAEAAEIIRSQYIELKDVQRMSFSNRQDADEYVARFEKLLGSTLLLVSNSHQAPQ